MATWVGTFVSNIDGEPVRKLEVEANDEVTAIVLLDFYEYDKTWRHYSFVDLHKKKSGNLITTLLKPLFSALSSLKLPGVQRRRSSLA